MAIITVDKAPRLLVGAFKASLIERKGWTIKTRANHLVQEAVNSGEIPAYTDDTDDLKNKSFHVRDISPAVRDQFVAECFRKGISIRDGILGLLQKDVEEWSKKGSRKAVKADGK